MPQGGAGQSPADAYDNPEIGTECDRANGLFRYARLFLR